MPKGKLPLLVQNKNTTSLLLLCWRCSQDFIYSAPLTGLSNVSVSPEKVFQPPLCPLTFLRHMCCWAHTGAHTSHMRTQTTCPSPRPLPHPTPTKSSGSELHGPMVFKKEDDGLTMDIVQPPVCPGIDTGALRLVHAAACPCHVTAPVLTCSNTHPLSCLGTPGPTSPSCHHEQCWCVHITPQDLCTKASRPCSRSRAIALQGTQRRLHGILQTFLLFSLVMSFRHSTGRRTV